MILPRLGSARGASMDVAVRVENLLARMTLDQKVGQMTQAERGWVTPDDVRRYHLGSILSAAGSAPESNTPEGWVAMSDAFWGAAVDGRTEGAAIPPMYGVDAVHGHNNARGATIFPHNIGLGATHDPDLVEKVARVTAREVLATGVDWTFAPTLAVARDIRWGRTYESFSEDPERVATYARRVVTGLQEGWDGVGVLACAKHWVGDGGTTDGVDQGDARLTEQELKDVHVAPYRAALEAGALTVMASYSSWNGVRCHGHAGLVGTMLKGELGFPGLVVSDFDAIEQLDPDYGRAVALAANAGIDLFMVSERWRELIETLRAQVRAGAVPMARIDDAVRRILLVKATAGLLDAPRPAARPGACHASFGSAAHRAVAREAVRKSLVLLKKRDGILPLRREARIVVVGKNADDRGHLCGGFSLAWQGGSGPDDVEGGTSVWEGIRAQAPQAVLRLDGTHPGGTVDAVVVVIGERPYAEGMGDIRASGSPGPAPAPGPKVHPPYGATPEAAALHPEDVAVLRRVADWGVPVVTVFVSGRPLMTDYELALSDAFIAAWLPGSEGAGIADLLFGGHDFQGRLAFSWPGVPSGASACTVRFPVGFGLTLGS